MTKVDGILFDLGDTLLDFGQVDVLSMFEAGGRNAYDYLTGLGLPMPAFGSYYRRQLWAIRWNFFKSRFTRREFNVLDILGQLTLRMGLHLSPHQTLELAWMWYEPLSRRATVEPGTRELLIEFRDSGLKLGVVSNTFVPAKVLDRHLENANLLDLLPVRVYSCDVRYRKPHPNIFAAALQQCGMNAPSTLFVGDSLQADIKGANQAGMISVLKDPASKHKRSKIRPVHRITALAELRQTIEQYNKQ